jgi:hypothetical protein
MRFLKILSVFLMLSLKTFCHEEPNIIFYNYNDLSYEHCEKVLKQTKLFNPSIKVYFIDKLKSRSKDLDGLKKLGVHFIPSESLRKSSLHKKYAKTFKSRFMYKEDEAKDPFNKWFVVHDMISHFDLKNTFFIDIDTLVYTDLKEFFGIFQNFYPKLASTFENEESSSHTILYIHDQLALEKLNKFILQEALNFSKPYKLLGNFRKEYGKEYIDSLPILPDDYIEETVLISLDGNKPKEKKDFSKNYAVFGSLFDSCAIGEYLAGYNLEVGFKQIGHINSRSIINPYHFRFDFVKDEKGRKVPYMIHKGQKIKINNLKIESLQIDSFLSY